MAETIVPVRTYLIVTVVLLILAALTFGVAFIDLGVMNTVIALAIAASKMALVGLFFMHIRYKPGLPRIVVLAGFFWLALLVALTVADGLTRNWIPPPSGWSSALRF